MIDSISQAEGIAMDTIQSKALMGIGAYSIPFLCHNYCNESIFYLCGIVLDCFKFKDFPPFFNLFNQHRFHWRSTSLVGQTSSLHEF